MGEQIPPGDHLAHVEREVVQQVEFAPAQIEGPAIEGDLMGVRVQPQAADLDRAAAGAVRLGAPQDRPDPGLDLARPERLDQIIICARVQRPDDLALVVAGGDHQHRHGADRTDHAQRLVPVEVRQPEIEQDGIGRRIKNLPQRDHGGGRAGYRMTALRQGADQRAPDGGIVLYQQQLGHDRTVTAEAMNSVWSRRQEVLPGDWLEISFTRA